MVIYFLHKCTLPLTLTNATDDDTISKCLVTLLNYFLIFSSNINLNPFNNTYDKYKSAMVILLPTKYVLVFNISLNTFNVLFISDLIDLS